jgi:hypothetical protein
VTIGGKTGDGLCCELGIMSAGGDCDLLKNGDEGCGDGLLRWNAPV